MDADLKQTEDSDRGQVQEMILLAERLRDVHGGDLDDAAIQAVSEASGIPVEYVRLAVQRLPEGKKPNLVQQFRNSFQALEPDTRRNVLASSIGSMMGLFGTIGTKWGDQYSIWGIASLLALGLGMWNVAVSKDKRAGAISGALLGASMFIAGSLFSFIFQAPRYFDSIVLVPYILIGALGGLTLQSIVSTNRNKFGLKDPQQERQELLHQLHEIQERLRTGDQSMAFLSLDIAGSTKMKESADPLSVEFTFTEYHKFVDMACKRYRGTVHSTAGDGVTCAFDHPHQAFAAARYIQAGLVELNTFRNRIGVPITLRAGIHVGTVNVPPGQDVTKVNFAHVIDVAAHLQKQCPIGGIAVSVEATQSLPGGPLSVGLDEITVENIRARVWQPKTVTPNTVIATPPPAPTLPSSDESPAV
ncbi:MAG: adenylate/guanylate cyclase domain-containing protein [Fimbriimonadaceae bacterium]|nr:adenylate/guanylate cyclase domain-containing protein [Fimbriimonadaceae bacterium]